MIATTSLSLWPRPEPLLVGRSLHPVVRVWIALGAALIVLIGCLFRLKIEDSLWNYLLHTAAAWGSLGLMVGTAFTVIYARFLPKRRAPLKSESNTVSLVALMILGFFELLVSHRAYATARMDHRMTVSAAAGELVITGAIGPSLPAEVRERVSSGQIHRLVLKANQGGDVIAAVIVGYTLKEHAITQVRIEGDCASSCAFLALMMPERFFGPTARLGFHDVRSLTGNRQQVGPEREILRAALMGAGHREEQVERMLATDDIAWFTPQELLDQGMVGPGPLQAAMKR